MAFKGNIQTNYRDKKLTRASLWSFSVFWGASADFKTVGLGEKENTEAVIRLK